MEKKNTMLLTVIAVSTLLVAVVGATFAYFSATGGDGDTTAVTVKTEELSQTSATGSASLILDVTAAQMVQGTSDTTLTSATPATLVLTTENNSTTSTMTCTYDITYSTTETYSRTDGIAADEFYLTFVGVLTDDATSSQTTIANYDLNDGSGDIATSYSYTVPVDTEGGITWTVEANFLNSSTVVQDKQAAMDYSGTITLSDVDCIVNDPA